MPKHYPAHVATQLIGQIQHKLLTDDELSRNDKDLLHKLCEYLQAGQEIPLDIRQQYLQFLNKQQRVNRYGQ